MTFILRIFIAGLLCAAVIGFAGQQKTLTVQVKNGQLRASSSFLGKPVAALTAGEKVTLIEEKGDWSQVTSARGVTGWIHCSALALKKVSMTAGSSTAETSVSGDELSLAGKGFNKDVEADFKAKNTALDFTWVDIMDTIKVSPREIEKFVSSGALRVQE